MDDDLRSTSMMWDTTYIYIYIYMAMRIHLLLKI